MVTTPPRPFGVDFKVVPEMEDTVDPTRPRVRLKRSRAVCVVAALLLTALLLTSTLSHSGAHASTELLTELPSPSRLVHLLAEEAHTPGVCSQRQRIIGKLTALLERLTVRVHTLNATDVRANDAAEIALQAWLDVESLYRLSQQKFDETTQASEFVLHQLMVQKKLKELTQMDVAQVCSNRYASCVCVCMCVCVRACEYACCVCACSLSKWSGAH